MQRPVGLNASSRSMGGRSNPGLAKVISSPWTRSQSSYFGFWNADCRRVFKSVIQNRDIPLQRRRVLSGVCGCNASTAAYSSEIRVKAMAGRTRRSSSGGYAVTISSYLLRRLDESNLESFSVLLTTGQNALGPRRLFTIRWRGDFPLF